jgi:hypothetical protein
VFIKIKNRRSIMFDLIVPTYSFALTYSQKLVADIADERMCEQPVPGRIMNHGAWTLGHLAWSLGNGLVLLGHSAPTSDWQSLFGTGSQPQSERTKYPAKEVLVRTLQQVHADLLKAVQAATLEQLNGPPHERMRHRFPTLGHMLAGLMTAHYASHNGQLSAWRRAMGWPGVF